MTSFPQRRRVAQLYSDGARRHGRLPQSVGWRDETTHTLRFEQLAYVLRHAAGPISVNDLGCGYGALYTYLRERGGVELRRFYGYDISQEMLEMARAAVPAPEAEFIESDRLLHTADYSFASGIFNVRFEADLPAWEEYVRGVLEDLHTHSRVGFAFNALSTYVDYREEHLYYADPGWYFDYCKRRFSPRVTLLHDYPLYEWTMVVSR